MSGTYFKKLMRRLTILLSQLAQLPHDLSHQASWIALGGLGSGKSGTPLKVLVVVHAYWPRQFAEIIKHLNRIKMPLSVMVTIPNGEFPVEIENLLGTISDRHEVLPMRVENTGRDIGPFLKCIEKFSNQNWDLVIKIHTKASQNIWFKSLLCSLLRSDRRIRTHARLLKRYPYGLIVHPLFRYPGHKHPIDEPAMQRLRSISRSSGFPIPRKWFFAAGSMFAATPEMLMDFKRKGETIGLTEFEDENEYSQASSAHVYERFLGLYVCTKGSGLFSTSILDFLDLKALFVKLI
jgi:lipopolysaccharide biosynthesis protein